jgi:two-component system response regulator FixJ
MEEKTVFIIDDDISVRNGLTRLLSASGINTESFASAREFLETKKYHNSGCILLDVRMPDMTGPELQEELFKEGSNIPIIFLSAHGDVPVSVNAMKNGAIDFLTKPVDKKKLLKVIEVAMVLDEKNRADSNEKKLIQKKIDTLTPREFEIMTYVITGMLNKQIAAELNISEETIKIHRGRVMHKLEIVSVPELTRLCDKADIKPTQKSWL